MDIYQNVVRFLKAALECSIYISPTDPGLTYDELVRSALDANFLEGEINEGIRRSITLYYGADRDKILPSKDYLATLNTFLGEEEPDYRNRFAFHRVFETMRYLVREKSLANAFIERSELVEKSAINQVSTHDIQVAVTILILNEILRADSKGISFARGKETYGSPGDPANMQRRAHGQQPMRREMRARAYPIVKQIIAARDQPSPTLTTGDTAQTVNVKLSQPTTAEWISAIKALDLLGHKPGDASAICKRAHAGLVKARAKRFIRGADKLDDVAVPPEFWWAEGGAALKQNWRTGDFETWIDHRIQLQAFGVEFLRSDIESMGVVSQKEPKVQRAKVFIGHGRSHLWLHLKNFLQDRLHLTVDEFNVEPTAGITTKERLEEMLGEAVFAFLVMTAEDDQPDGTKRARENVIHEVGLFQGRLGFRKAIVMLEEGCNEFSNIAGIGEIRFNRGDIQSKFEEVRRTLEREDIIKSQ